MYRDLRCQHHLVQERYYKRLDIPDLAPAGFKSWVTLLIRAHPEKDTQVFTKPIWKYRPAFKTIRKRVPKGNIKTIVPRHKGRRIRGPIEDSTSEHAAVELPRRSSQEEPRPYHSSPIPYYKANRFDKSV